MAPDSILQSLNEKGVLVLGCAPGSPAARAGLHPSLRDQETGRMMLGDIITKFDDEKVALSPLAPDVLHWTECVEVMGCL